MFSSPLGRASREGQKIKPHVTAARHIPHKNPNSRGSPSASWLKRSRMFGCGGLPSRSRDASSRSCLPRLRGTRSSGRRKMKTSGGGDSRPCSHSAISLRGPHPGSAGKVIAAGARLDCSVTRKLGSSVRQTQRECLGRTNATTRRRSEVGWPGMTNTPCATLLRQIGPAVWLAASKMLDGNARCPRRRKNDPLSLQVPGKAAATDRRGCFIVSEPRQDRLHEGKGTHGDALSA